jgi:hypothetical protein
MLLIKKGVMPNNLRIAAACINVAIENNLSLDIVITSGVDGKHMVNSDHYAGNALDVRSKVFQDKDEKLWYASKVMEKLGKDYQFLLEFEGKPNEHFHFQYHPKKSLLEGTSNV